MVSTKTLLLKHYYRHQGNKGKLATFKVIFRLSGYFNLWRLSPKNNPKRFLGCALYTPTSPLPQAALISLSVSATLCHTQTSPNNMLYEQKGVYFTRREGVCHTHGDVLVHQSTRSTTVSAVSCKSIPCIVIQRRGKDNINKICVLERVGEGEFSGESSKNHCFSWEIP